MAGESQLKNQIESHLRNRRESQEESQLKNQRESRLRNRGES